MNRSKELLVGAVIIGAVAVAVVGTLWLQGTNFGRTLTEVDVLVESVSQLQPGNRVTYRGVRIGQVSLIAVEPGGDGVRITLLLDEEVGLPSDPAVVLGPESLFGGWQAEIVSMATVPEYPFFTVPPGESADRLVLGGYALPELSRLTASAEQISQNVAELTDRMELAFNQETADNLIGAIDNIQAITEELRTLVAQQAAVAVSIGASADSALMEVEVAAQAARRTFEDMETIVGGPRMDTLLTNITAASAGFRQVTAELADTTGGLGATLERADSAFTRIDRISARLEAGEGSLGRLLVDTTLAIRAEDLLAQLDRLLEDVRANPRRYVRLSIF